jgi:transposase-like protein
MGIYRITNEEKERIVRLITEKPRIAYWELAAKLGKHENTVSRWLRRPTAEQAELLEQAIREIREDQKG